MRYTKSLIASALILTLLGCSVRIARMGAASDPPLLEIDGPGISVTVRPILIEFERTEKENEK